MIYSQQKEENEMKQIFNKSILEQLYAFRKEDFEQDVYNNNSEVKELELKMTELSENFVSYLKKAISNEDELNEVLKLFRNYESESSKETDFWGLIYFKMGVNDGIKMSNELLSSRKIKKEDSTFLNYENNNFSEWLEVQKRKYSFDTLEYKELQNKYRKISEKYPNATEVFEDFKPMELNKEEVEALIELRKIDVEMGDMEKDLCFKLGMKEIINF